MYRNAIYFAMQYYRQNWSEIFYLRKLLQNCKLAIFRKFWLFDFSNLKKKWSQIWVYFALSLTVSKEAFLDTKIPENWAIWFGCMPKTKQIAAKEYRTDLERKIENLKPGSAFPTPQKIGPY